MPISWTDGSPSEIAANIRIIAEQIPTVVQNVAIDQASRAQSEMKRGRPWQDQTSAARRDLFGKAEQHSWGSRIILGGGAGASAPYFRYLELGTYRMGPFPILLPTMLIYRVSALRMASLAVKGLLG